MGKSTELRNKIIAKLAEALQTEPGSEGYTMEACAAIALEVEGAMDAGFSKATAELRVVRGSRSASERQ